MSQPEGLVALAERWEQVARIVAGAPGDVFAAKAEILIACAKELREALAAQQGA